MTTFYSFGCDAAAAAAASSLLFPQEAKKSTAKKEVNIDEFLMCI